ARRAVGNQVAQTARRDVGKTEVDRASHVKLVVLLTASRVKNDRSRLCRHAHELILGHAARLAVVRSLTGNLKVARHIDGRILDPRGEKKSDGEGHVLWTSRGMRRLAGETDAELRAAALAVLEPERSSMIGENFLDHGQSESATFTLGGEERREELRARSRVD